MVKGDIMLLTYKQWDYIDKKSIAYDFKKRMLKLYGILLFASGFLSAVVIYLIANI